ncbi:MAG: pilus assembly PilX family protein [Pseudomonadota bacterium]
MHPLTIASPIARGQRGAALIIGLIFLVLLTLIGVTAVGVSSLEERMSGNTRDQLLAFNAAEAGLRDCEAQLQFATPPTFDGVTSNSAVTATPGEPGMYQPASAGNTPVWEIVDWDNANEVRFSQDIPQGAAEAPKCIIEELPPIPGSGGNTSLAFQPLPETGIYRVTALGIGRNDTTQVMLQSTYTR